MINTPRPKPGFTSRRFARLPETERAPVHFVIDGNQVEALAGFCLMDACQDCRVWIADGERPRSCTTVVEKGRNIVTRQPEATWTSLA